MENQVRKRLTAALAMVLAVASVPISARDRKEQADSLVRLMKAESIEQLVINGQQYRKAVSSTFLHNGTYLISDTALWNVDTKVINAVGHVKVIQDETILTSDKLDYKIDDNLAEFRGTLVQLQNKKNNLLRTRCLDYNTKDSVAVFRDGAAMRDADGQIIESLNGYYYSNSKMFLFNENVNMFSDSIFVKTNRLYYYSEENKADFPVYIDFWKGGNMLSAESGWYDRGRETVFFKKSVHGMSEDQEVWSDTLYYYRGTGDMLLLGHAQVQDPSRQVTAVADRIHYSDTLNQVMLQRNAAVALETDQNSRRDTMYVGADTLIYRTIRRCDIPEGTVKACDARLSDILTDAVTEFRRKAAEAAAAAAEQARQSNNAPGGGKSAGKGGPSAGGGPGAPDSSGEAPVDGGKAGKRGKSDGGGKDAPGKKDSRAPRAPETPAAAAPEAPAAPVATADSALTEAGMSPAAPLDSALTELPAAPGASGDTLAVADSAAAAMAHRDSLFAPLTEAVAAIDSLVGTGAPADSLAAQSPSAGGFGPARPGELAQRDSLPLRDSTAVPDSLLQSDSLASADSLQQLDTVKLDTTKIGFAYGIRNVKVFRKDIQLRCDSLAYCDLDSIARFYLDPVVWNDGNRQYSSDSLFVLVGGGGPRKASLQSNAFIIIEEDEKSYDQIKGTEVMAYFDSLDSSLKRFDAMGGSSAIFYIHENDAFATVNKVESKMLSGLLKDGNIDQVYYFESPKNNAYPVVQFPESESRMKGFDWRPDERPTGPLDITDLKMRSSQRSYYLGKPRAEFRQTEIYFPGYMPKIRREIAIRDSLSRLPKPKITQKDTLLPPPALRDSLGFVPDSLESFSRDTLAAFDSLAVADSIALAGVVEPVDTLAVRDTSTVVAPAGEEDPLAVPTVDPKQKRKEERELRRKLRIAARDARIAAREARWAELDRQDSLKLEAKKLKELEKQREKTRKALIAIQKQDAKDQAKLQKYIARYRKQYERQQKREATRKRSQAPEPGREVPATDGTGEEAPGSDPVLRDDGSPDDNPVLRGRGVPGT